MKNQTSRHESSGPWDIKMKMALQTPDGGFKLNSGPRVSWSSSYVPLYLSVNQWDADPVVMEKHAALRPVFIQLLTHNREVVNVKCLCCDYSPHSIKGEGYSYLQAFDSSTVLRK